MTQKYKRLTSGLRGGSSCRNAPHSLNPDHVGSIPAVSGSPLDQQIIVPVPQRNYISKRW
uniref:Uncharacterized protein n=1 Tax=Anguilla anguilla TaxID=7936 RepID=A0A0E9SQ22_ANGAN